MFGSIAKSLFGSSNDRYVNSIRKIVDKVNAFEPTMQSFDDATLQDGWANAIAQVGTRTQSAQYATNMSTTIANNLERDRLAVSGVNLDEEAAKLIQYQQAYQASAKMLQVAQSIFDNLMQTVGR